MSMKRGSTCRCLESKWAIVKSLEFLKIINSWKYHQNYFKIQNLSYFSYRLLLIQKSSKVRILSLNTSNNWNHLEKLEEFENLCYITLMLALYPRKNIINVVRWREREKEIIPRTMTMDKDEATPLSYYSRATPIFFPMRPRAWGGRRFSICISLPLIALFLFAFYLHPWIPIRYRELVIQRTTTRVGSIEREKENRRTVEEMYKLL